MRFLRSGLMGIVNIGTQDPMPLLLVKEELVIQTLWPHAAHKPFTDGIGSRCPVGRFQELDAASGRHASKTGATCALTITDELFRPHTKDGGESSLLRGPRGGG